MKSNICKIENGSRSLDAILRESEKVAVYNELNHKQTMQLRLLCEEMDGMLPNIVNFYSGDFWIEFDKGVCKINISVELKDLTKGEKDELIGIAKDKKNASASGITGKIRSAIESLFIADMTLPLNTMPHGMFSFSTDHLTPIDYTYFWSMNQYRNNVIKEQMSEEWDELEKSVIASIADDVIVGIKGKQADIVIIKEFA